MRSKTDTPQHDLTGDGFEREEHTGSVTISEPEPGGRMKWRGLRWWIVVLLFGAAVLNYVDRQTLSALAPTIQVDLGMDDRSYANVVNIFLVAYTIAYLISGRIADIMGTRASMVLFVVWWSVASIFTAAAKGVTSLGVYRFLLGLGEAGIWPAASKAVSEWFPARERALAIGFYTMGATVGATLAPYIIIPLATHAYHESMPVVTNWLGHGTGWRVAFILTGLAGLIWVIPWLWIYRQPRQSKLISKDELQLIEQSAATENPADSNRANAWSWKQVFLFRGTWLLLLGRLITDPVWYFYQFWFAKYLSADRHLSQDQLKITWIVYAAAGVGSLLGGWLSGQFVKRGFAPAASRLWVMLGCAGVMPLSPFIAHVAGLNFTMTLTVCTVFASLAWLINISSLVVDVVPKHSLGTVFSVVATGSTIGGIIMNMIVAAMVSGPAPNGGGFLDEGIKAVVGPVLALVQGHGYAQWFLIMAFLHPIAWLVLKFGGIHKLAPVKITN
ncbi:MAG TPA: MFS transporter [Verrucomicrobiae bacterium]|nr:MFS transporter [Verrucomicrobiae bacterium]